MNTEKKNLYYLEELDDYKVKNDDKDVRNWTVKDADGREIGTVDNLIVNKNTERVVYLDVAVDQTIIDDNFTPYSLKASNGVHDTQNEDGDTHLIVPIGLVDLNLEDEIVCTNKVNYKTFAETKRKTKGYAVDRAYEISVLESYNRDGAYSYNPEDQAFYENDIFRR